MPYLAAYLILGCLVISNLLIRPRIPGRSKRPAHMQFPAPDMKAILTDKAYWITIAGGFLIMWGLCNLTFRVNPRSRH
jgi:hypothetical protein